MIEARGPMDLSFRAGIPFDVAYRYLNGNETTVVRVEIDSHPHRGAENLVLAGAEVGAGFVPVLGELQDLDVLVGPGDHAWWVRGLAGVSLAVNFYAVGFAPNLGGFLRGGERLAEGAADASRAVKGLEEAAEAAAGASRRAGDVAGSLAAPIGRMADHHIFPVQFRNFFSRRGVNIDDFTITIEHQYTHLRGIHGRGNMGQFPGRWNARWREFVVNNPNATSKDICDFAGGLMDEFGLGHLPIHPYGQ